eukprot:m.76666 g.76666  ORF g.76666 m.76666 type:complete len:52 (+) comp12495_c1_seq1:5056-5211(+)
MILKEICCLARTATWTQFNEAGPDREGAIFLVVFAICVAIQLTLHLFCFMH